MTDFIKDYLREKNKDLKIERMTFKSQNNILTLFLNIELDDHIKEEIVCYFKRIISPEIKIIIYTININSIKECFLATLDLLGININTEIIFRDELIISRNILEESIIKSINDDLFEWKKDYKLIIEKEESLESIIEDELTAMLLKENNKPTKRKVKKTNLRYFKEIKTDINPISDILSGNLTRATVIGEIVNLDERLLRNQKILIDYTIFDGTNCIGAKMFLEKKELEEVKEYIKIGLFVKVQANVQFDTYSKEIVLMPSRINKVNKASNIRDDSLEKRIELSVQTSMSELDGIHDVNKYIERALEYGHKAIGICDNSSFHSYPTAIEMSKRHNIKILYGYQANLYDDTIMPIDIDCEIDYSGTYVAIDIETTGLRNKTEEIIELAAVRFNNYEIVDTYTSLVRPRKSIPEFVMELTGISDADVKNERYIEEVLPEFLDFIKDDILVAHNIEFDYGFLKRKASDIGRELNNQKIDTLALSRLLLTDIKRHRLNQVAKWFKIPLENHHRALDDSIVCGKILISLFRILESKLIFTKEEINKLANKEFHISNSRSYNINIYPKTTSDCKFLYKLVSECNLNHIRYQRVLMPLSIIKLLTKERREGLIIGCGGADGLLSDAIIMGRDKEYIDKISEIFDFMEIQPLGLYARYCDSEKKEDIIDIHQDIFDFAKEKNKILVATTSCKYLEKNEFIYRNIVRDGQNKNMSLEKEGNYHFRNTQDMIDEFSHLGSESKTIVVDNSKIISDMIGEVLPIPEGRFPPEIEGSEEYLRNKCMQNAVSKYSKELPKIVEDRLSFELNAIIGNGFASLYIASEILVNESHKMGYLVGSRGSVGSSFAANMCGITEVNPLPPHYYCKTCQYSEFPDESLYPNGFDMPSKKCPKCGANLDKDGFNIPFESFMGFDGNKEPDIDLNFAPKIQTTIQKHTETIFGEGSCYKAGTISKVADKTAYGYVMKYVEKTQQVLTRREIDRIAKQLTGIKRSTGQHPAGIMVVPKGHTIYEFSPIQRPANDEKTDVITTHFDYDAIKGRLLKLDILGHDVPTIIYDLEQMTGVNSSIVRFDDKEVIELFNSTNPLRLIDERYDLKKGTLGIPEFGTNFVREMLDEAKPQSLEDLVRISGLSHGTNVWLGNAQTLIKDSVTTLEGVIATREQVMVYSMQKGLSRDMAFGLMEKIKKGKRLEKEEIEAMTNAGIPKWYIDSCNKMGYMFPKAHAAAYVLMSFRIAYYKIHHPLAFYSAYLGTKIEHFDNDIMARGIDRVLSHLRDQLEKTASKKEQEIYSLAESVYEMYARGIEFLPADLYKSCYNDFKIEDGKLRLPLRAVNGVTQSTALRIVEVRKNKFISIEDIQERAKVNKSGIEGLRLEGCLQGLDETNQISLFKFLS